MKNKFFIVIGAIIIGIILSYLYSQVIIPQLKDKFWEHRDKIEVRGDRAILNIYLARDAYLLKIKHFFQKDQPSEILVNGLKVKSLIFHYIRKKGIIETDYIKLSPAEIKPENNSVVKVFPKNKPFSVDIILSNYRRKIADDICILFSDSVAIANRNISFKTYILIIIITFLLIITMIFLVRKIFYLSINRLFLYQTYSFLPMIILLSLLLIGSALSKNYIVVLSPTYFWTLFALSFFSTEGLIVLLKLLSRIKMKEITFANPLVIKFTDSAIRWISTRCFSDKCVLLFMFLLLACAFLLILHLEPIAEQLANIAYFSLVTGVLIKFIQLIKDNHEKV